MDKPDREILAGNLTAHPLVRQLADYFDVGPREVAQLDAWDDRARGTRTYAP